MTKRAARPSALAEGGFGAFVLDQLSGLDGVDAKPMFGGAGFYLDGAFFGILYKEHLYFRVSAETVGDYTKRKMKPFEPFEGRRGTSRNYYQVPIEIVESPRDLVAWARKAATASAEGKGSRTASRAENKTRPTDASVDDYIASRATVQQLVDCRELMAMLKKVTRHKPRMWGPSIVGYGSYRYTYESGRTGEMPVAAFAIRGRELVVYLMPDAPGQKSLLARLGKHKMCKSCLYFKQLADVDWSVLEKLVVGSIEEARRRYR